MYKNSKQRKSKKKCRVFTTQHFLSQLVFLTKTYVKTKKLSVLISPATHLVHLIVDLDDRLRNRPVFVLALHELQRDARILEWVVDLVVELVRLCLRGSAIRRIPGL